MLLSRGSCSFASAAPGKRRRIKRAIGAEFRWLLASSALAQLWSLGKEPAARAPHVLVRICNHEDAPGPVVIEERHDDVVPDVIEVLCFVYDDGVELLAELLRVS